MDLLHVILVVAVWVGIWGILETGILYFAKSLKRDRYEPVAIGLFFALTIVSLVVAKIYGKDVDKR